MGIPIYSALQLAGFTKRDVRLERNDWYGISIHGSRKDAVVSSCIGEAIGKSKKIVFIGLLGVSDPEGSPVTIEVGVQPLGALPKK